MNFELLFSIAGIVAMAGWLLLLVSPVIPKWSDRIAGTFLPVVLSLGYVMLVVVPSAESGGGFATLADVMILFPMNRPHLRGGSIFWPLICSSGLGFVARPVLKA